MKNLEKHELYNGEITLLFDPQRHQYFVGELQVDGCTGILGAIAKPALVPWAVGCAADFLLAELKPGVALDELQIKELATGMKRAHTIKRDTAADVGTLIHQWCEDHIKGKNPPFPINEKLRNGVAAFLDWKEKHNVKFTESERKIFSRRHKYAGTLDAEGLVDSKLAIIDFKTGAAFYPEQRFQVAAYEAARREESGQSYTRWLIRLDKNTGEFEARQFNELGKDFAAFLGIFEAYKRLKELKKEK